MEKTKERFREIPLEEISLNPRNPRKEDLAGPAFHGLVASVKEKGVIEPIIVRPKKLKNTNFEIVAGTRRYYASERAGLPAIPAIIRELTDGQAFDFMIIENLQRKDLTEFEEAQSLKLYVGKHGDAGVRELAEKTGVSPQYIRRRMAVMSLPEYALAAWGKGRLRYGHLEQLLRIKETPKVKEFFKFASSSNWRDEACPVEELKKRIDNESPVLSMAYFPITPEGCETCPKNSMVQRDLFGIDDAKKTRCLDPACFKKKQNDWLIEHWDESPLHKNYGTNGFRYEGTVRYNDHETIRHSFTPDEKCKACPHFLTLLDAMGQVSRGDEQECFNKACLRSRVSKMRGEQESNEKKGRKPGEPRVSWHGEYFRDVFLMKRIPEALVGFAPSSQEMIMLLLVTALHGNTGAKVVVGKLLKISDAAYFGNHQKLFAKILSLPYSEVDRLIPETVKAIVMEGQHVGEYSGFGTRMRYSVARFLGVDLAKEYAVSDEYLQKKTKAEIVAFLRKFGLLKEKKLVEYLAKHFKRIPKEVDKIKKSELIDIVLKSGVELRGKVPDEIIREEASRK